MVPYRDRNRQEPEMLSVRSSEELVLYGLLIARSLSTPALRRGSARQISPGVGRSDETDETIEDMELTARIKQPIRHKPLDH
jgi:hypothetical protein